VVFLFAFVFVCFALMLYVFVTFWSFVNKQQNQLGTFVLDVKLALQGAYEGP